MPYINQCFCKYCEEKLTTNQVMYSEGRCPLCGIKGENACTVVDIDEEAIWVEKRFITINKIFGTFIAIVIILLFLIWSK